MTAAAVHADHDLEALLRRHSITFELINIPIDEVDWKATEAAQIRSKGVDAETVERYTAAIERGEFLPAGFGTLVESRWTVVGGQHRARAYLAAGEAYLPLYAVKGATVDLWRASVEHNSRHGLTLSAADRTALAMTMVDEQGMTVNDAAAVAGIHPVSVSRARTIRIATRTAARTGVTSIWQPLSAEIRYTLAAAAKGRSDAVFQEMVATAIQCNVTRALATQMSGLLSKTDVDDDEAAFDALGEFEAGWHPGASKTGGPSEASKLRGLALQICDIDPDEVAGSMTHAFSHQTEHLLERAVQRLAQCAVAVKGVTAKS